MSYKTLTVNTINKVCTMKFNRPDKLNAFDTQMVLETQDALNQIAEDTRIKALIITGEGKGFSAGADLSDSSGIDDLSNDRLVYEGLVNGYKPSLLQIMNMPKPVIGAINGAAAGIATNRVAPSAPPQLLGMLAMNGVSVNDGDHDFNGADFDFSQISMTDLMVAMGPGVEADVAESTGGYGGDEMTRVTSNQVLLNQTLSEKTQL